MLSRSFSLSLTLASTLLCSLVAGPAIAQEITEQGQFQFNPQPGSSVGFMPTDRRMPIRTASGGRRGTCAATDAAVVPLLPQNGGALSATESPSFWVYVPAGVKGTAHFRLTDASQADFDYQSVALPERGGLVKVELSQASKALRAGETYQWFFSVDCTATDDDGMLEAGRSQDTFVTGWVRYEPLAASTQAEALQGSTLDQAIAFARLGYWHDSLDRIANLRNLQNLQQTGAAGAEASGAWDELLNTAGLEVQTDGAIVPLAELISRR